MKQSETILSGSQAGKVQAIDARERSPLDELLREGARQMLLLAIDAEVADYIDQHRQEVDEQGHQRVVRNGHGQERTVVTPVGPLRVRAPRVNDLRVDEEGERCRFSSKILPPYLRRTKSVEELIPWLYLKGISVDGEVCGPVGRRHLLQCAAGR